MRPGGKIGVYDSGLGGLPLLRALELQLPQFSYVYVGDTAHKPFSTKPAAEVREFTQRGVSFLFDQGCELVILACTVASASALGSLQQQFLPTYAPHRHVLGVVSPAVAAAVMATHSNRIGVVAAQATVDSHAFPEEIQTLRPEATILQQAAPELIPMIEAGLHQTREMRMVLEHYLYSLQAADIDTLILGGGHYELVAAIIAEIMGGNVQIIRQTQTVPNAIQEYLFQHAELSHKLTAGSPTQFFYTSSADVFAGLSQNFYGAPLMAQEVKL